MELSGSKIKEQIARKDYLGLHTGFEVKLPGLESLFKCPLCQN